jgi:hypothetical protein
MASATAMYWSGKNPLRKVHRAGGDVIAPKSPHVRKLHKAFLRYHDADNWPVLRQALQRMGRSDLIGYSARHLVPPRQPAGWVPKARAGKPDKPDKGPRRGRFYTQHTGLPPAPAARTRGRARRSETN